MVISVQTDFLESGLDTLRSQGLKKAEAGSILLLQNQVRLKWVRRGLDPSYNDAVTKRPRLKRFLKIAGGGLLSLVLISLLYARSIVMESPSYSSMRGARQDGFHAPIMGGSPLVRRYYTLDRPLEVTLQEVRLELATRGWTEVKAKGYGMWFFGDQEVGVLITPIAGQSEKASVRIEMDSSFPEEILGTLFKWIPDRVHEIHPTPD